MIHAARRELAEETGVEASELSMIGIYDTPGRDPRGWSVSIAYLVTLPSAVTAQGADDAADADWFPVDQLPPLAFDHDCIVADAIR